MQLFNYNPHPFLFIAFSCSIICFIAFPSMFFLYIASQHVLWFLQHVPLLFAMIYLLILLAQPSWARICLNSMLELKSTCLCFLCHVNAQIYVPMFRSMPLWAPCHAYGQIYVFMCSVPCLCAQIYVGVYAMCFYSPFVP